MNSKEPFHDTHGIDSEETGKDYVELCFNGITCGEEYKIINLEAQSKRDEGRVSEE